MISYGVLKQAVLAEAHRPDLTAEVVGFIRRAEGMIRRELVGFELEDIITATDTIGDGVYTLPAGLHVIRGVFGTSDAGQSYPLENVGVANIRALSAQAPPLQYAVRSGPNMGGAFGGSIEIRGIPTDQHEFEIHYFGHPQAFEDDSDYNTLLEDHEEIYISGALFHLYKHTQDLELAQGALDTFKDAIERLNEMYARMVGGASNQGAYNFGHQYPAGSSM